MKSALLAVLLGCSAMALCACSPKALTPPQPARTVSANFNAVWDASAAVLWEYRFTVDQQDRRAGVMTTLPLTSRHWFEVWRHDEPTWRDKWEGTLQTVYRQIIVTVRPVGQESSPTTLPTTTPSDGAVYLAHVEVHVYRSDKPNPEIQTPAEAYSMFVRPESVIMGDTPVANNPATLDDLGRDNNLERILEEKINARAAKIRPGAYR